jgi:hypothetical protein
MVISHWFLAALNIKRYMSPALICYVVHVFPVTLELWKQLERRESHFLQDSNGITSILFSVT